MTIKKSYCSSPALRDEPALTDIQASAFWMLNSWTNGFGVGGCQRSEHRRRHAGTASGYTPYSGHSVHSVQSLRAFPSLLFTPSGLCVKKGRNCETNPSLKNHPKSNPASPKSTVDLVLEPLIWVENTFRTSSFSPRQHSFRPISTRPWRASNRLQTVTNQKMNQLHPLIWVDDPFLKPETYCHPRTPSEGYGRFTTFHVATEDYGRSPGGIKCFKHSLNSGI